MSEINILLKVKNALGVVQNPATEESLAHLDTTAGSQTDLDAANTLSGKLGAIRSAMNSWLQNGLKIFTTNVEVTQVISTSTGTVELDLPGGISSTSFQLSVASGTPVGTFHFESSVDGAIRNLRVYRTAGILNTLATSTTAVPSEHRGNSAGMKKVRVRASALSGGTVTVTITGSTGVGAVFLNAAIPIGQQSAGNTFTAQSVPNNDTLNGVFENMENVSTISINFRASKAGTFNIVWSKGGTTDDLTIPYVLAVNELLELTLDAGRAQFFRTSFANSGPGNASVDQEVTYRATPTGMFKLALSQIGKLRDEVLAPVMQSLIIMKVAANQYAHAIGDAINGLRVNDRMGGFEALADQNGAGSVLTFSFTNGAPPDLIWVRSVGGVSRVDPSGGNPAANKGVYCGDGENTPIPFSGSITVKVFAPAGVVVAVWGNRYL